MAPTIKWALIAILVIFAVFYLLRFAGVALP
jgi:hypothetical protein